LPFRRRKQDLHHPTDRDCADAPLRRGDDVRYRFPVLPDQAEELQDPTADEPLRWRWRWVLGHREASNGPPPFAPPGALIQVGQPAEIYPRIAGLMSTHLFHGEPQTMHGSFQAAAAHGTDTRYVVEGPAVVMLVALVSGGRLDLVGAQLEIPFGNTYGSLEGVDVETDDFLRSPVRWLVP